MIKTTIGLFILGLTFGIGPCMASCAPLLVSYFAGTKKNVRQCLGGYLLFSLSRISVYLILAVLIYFLGQVAIGRFMGSASKFVFVLGGLFIFFIGVAVSSGRTIKFANKNVVIMGLTIGLLPCAPMIAVISYVALVSKSWIESGLYSLSFGLGTLISPLAAIAIITGLMPKLLIRMQGPYARIFRIICGSVIIFLGLQLVSRSF